MTDDMIAASAGCIGHEAYGINPPDWYYQGSKRALAWMVPDGCKRLLEIGCAEGRFGAHLKESRGCEVWGIEFNPDAAGRAAKKLDRVLVGDAEVVIDGMAQGYFDCIVLFDVLEHMMNPESVLRKAIPLLVEGGTIAICVPNVLYVSNLYHLLLNKDWKYIDHGVLDITHLRFFTKKSLRRLLVEAGYDVLLAKGINPPTGAFLLLFHLFNILTLGHLYESKFTQFVVTARPRR